MCFASFEGTPFLNLIKIEGLMLAFSSLLLIALFICSMGLLGLSLLAGLIALVLSAIPVSFQSWKAARRNPIEALRSE